MGSPKHNSEIDRMLDDDPRTTAKLYVEVLSNSLVAPADRERPWVEVTDPSTAEVIGQVPANGHEEVKKAVSAASSAWEDWRARLPRERADILHRWAEMLRTNADRLACLMTLEQGKPLADARGEIEYSASYLTWYAEEASRIYGETIPSHLPARQMTVEMMPIGVVAAITPWNFPMAMLARKAAAALAAGCPVVAVPSKVTPYSALALADLGHQVGIPKDIFQVLTGHSRTLVAALCDEPLIRGVSYTGSTEVGRLIMAQCAPQLKRVSLELGGHAPFLVFEDADLDRAVTDAVAAKFQTSGQDCLAANRIYIHQDIYEEFCQRFAEAAGDLSVGCGFQENVEIGPMATEDTRKKTKDHVEDARNHGARILLDGESSDSGLLASPTVLADVTSEMKISFEETFGPVAALIPFLDDDDVVARANDTEYGLVAYVYTQSLQRAQTIPARLEYGMVAVNTPKLTGAPIPFGGIKQSGMGREGSHMGLREFTYPQYRCVLP